MKNWSGHWQQESLLQICNRYLLIYLQKSYFKLKYFYIFRLIISSNNSSITKRNKQWGRKNAPAWEWCIQDIFQKKKSYGCSCDQSNYESSQTFSWKRHTKNSIPMWSVSKCSNHDFFLMLHKRSMHDGVRYPCDQCEYAATRILNLKLHIARKHDCIWCPCDQC